jgi:hypothetical protein
MEIKHCAGVPEEVWVVSRSDNGCPTAVEVTHADAQLTAKKMCRLYPGVGFVTMLFRPNYDDPRRP